MFEVIWSVFADAYVVREIQGLSRVVPKFRGSRAECTAWIAKNT